MSVPDISYEDLEANIASSLSNVFDTMLDEACQLQVAEDLSSSDVEMPRIADLDEASIYVGSVGFVGEINGVIYLYLSESLMRSIASKITELPVDQIESEIASDVCGELANMFGGGIKTGIAKLGHESSLTIPTVLSGHELFISTMGVARYIRGEFSLMSESIFADLALADIV